MTTIEKIFFWAGIIETTLILFLLFGAWALNKEEDIRIREEERYSGKRNDPKINP
jgi:hypothetical protein